ncbi:MAG TPA: hypothetical protein PKV95_00170 [Anaerolineaceae bacterium]|jgi:uncharacterized phage infection (PIP) family protein YhgE|nr:hypothetical protein [Longilinea sp.]HNZ00048.1 hypothetical protein [Anaerolineaceae bacterium]HOD43252.1 hypothetical protein [Anaerolineaceae bacterium]HOU43021.1 hypothetical protein [Anaerolineaceae bacterium]HPA31969.1 hypothetical protein [Anaerolineaceae bacterium]
MELEQVIQRLEWLEEERRKDKLAISTYQERIAALEGNIPTMMQQIRELSTELARVSATLGRLDQLESTIAQVRVEFGRSLEATERQRAEREREQERVRQGDVDVFNKAIADVRKGLEPIAELKRGLQSRQEEDFRLARLIEELEQKVLLTKRSDDDYKHAQKLLEDSQRQDAKRLTDLQGEVAALRKRQEEQRGKVDINTDSIRKLETRLGEIQTNETERRQSQLAFFEKQTMVNVERDRIWKDWQTRFDEIAGVSTNIDTQLQALDNLQRTVKRAQEDFEEITQRFERRINEITEMQRLMEDRFRQEWVGFRADDQKRWTNYALSQEEQQREVNRQYQQLTERMAPLEEMVHDIQDYVQQINEETGKRLQAILTAARQLLDQYDQTLGKRQ